MKDRLTEELVAMRVARELNSGDYCNLGIGFPQSCVSHIGKDIRVQSENGAIGYGPLIDYNSLDKADADYIDAGAMFFTTAPGMCFFDMITSFGMIRSGRLVGVIGGLQVSEKGDLAAHSVDYSDKYPQIGGSMDLAWGAKRLIVAMTHNTKDGKPKIVKNLTLPLTAARCIDLIVTDIAVIEVTEKGLELKEVAPGWTPEEVQSFTEAPLIITPEVKEIDF